MKEGIPRANEEHMFWSVLSHGVLSGIHADLTLKDSSPWLSSEVSKMSCQFMICVDNFILFYLTILYIVYRFLIQHRGLCTGWRHGWDGAGQEARYAVLPLWPNVHGPPWEACSARRAAAVQSPALFIYWAEGRKAIYRKYVNNNKDKCFVHAWGSQRV